MLNCTLAYRFLELVESFFKLADKLCDAEFKAQQLVLNEIKQWKRREVIQVAMYRVKRCYIQAIHYALSVNLSPVVG